MGILQNFDLEHWFETAGIEYKHSFGQKGEHLVLKHCPCGEYRDKFYKTYINKETGIGNCFYCDRVFNKWSLVATYLKTEDNRVIKDYIKEFSVHKFYQPDRKIKKKSPRAYVDDGGEIQLPCSYALPTDEGLNLAYPEQRGVDSEYAKRFRLRFCERGYWKYYDEEGKLRKIDFSNRVIIPYYDINGKLATFQGRSIFPELKPKYLFPKGLISPSSILYNAHESAAFNHSHVILCEGVFDVISVRKALDHDLENFRGVGVVASSGKHLSLRGQLPVFHELQKRGLRRVTVMFDGERQAYLSALKVASVLDSRGFEVYVALLPQGSDPNEVSSSVVRSAIMNAKIFRRTLLIAGYIDCPYKE